MRLSSLFDKKLIFLDYHFKDYGEILNFVSVQIAYHLDIPSSSVKRALEKRENLGTTILDHGLALPHGYLSDFDDILILFIRLDQEMVVERDCRQLPIKYVFVIITSKNKAQLYLKTLGKIAEIVTTNSHILDNAHSPSDLIQFIDQKQITVEESLTAGDLIFCKVVIQEKDNISKAVDVMKKYNLNFLPVVDDFRKLIGVIDIVDLFVATLKKEKVSKESLSLIEDLGPLSEMVVEPIRQFWENEENHTVNEVMSSSETYVVNKNASYVDIVFLMTKYHHKNFVVIDENQRVAGIIDSGDVVHKMIRA